MWFVSVYDANPPCALAIVSRTLTNCHEEICAMPIGKRLSAFCHADAGLGLSDLSETSILPTVSNLAKGQINEQCLSTIASFANSRGVHAHINHHYRTGITLPVPVLSEHEPSIEQLLPCWKNKHLP